MGYQYYDLKSLGNPIREMFDQAVSDLETFIHYAAQQYPIDRTNVICSASAKGPFCL